MVSIKTGGYFVIAAISSYIINKILLATEIFIEENIPTVNLESLGAQFLIPRMSMKIYAD